MSPRTKEYSTLLEGKPYEIYLPGKITYEARLIRRTQFVMDNGYFYLQMLPEHSNVVIYLRKEKQISCKKWLNFLFWEKD